MEILHEHFQDVRKWSGEKVCHIAKILHGCHDMPFNKLGSCVKLHINLFHKNFPPIFMPYQIHSCFTISLLEN